MCLCVCVQLVQKKISRKRGRMKQRGNLYISHVSLVAIFFLLLFVCAFDLFANTKAEHTKFNVQCVGDQVYLSSNSFDMTTRENTNIIFIHLVQVCVEISYANNFGNLVFLFIYLNENGQALSVLICLKRSHVFVYRQFKLNLFIKKKKT